MPDITDITGVSDTRAENLAEEGFETVEDVAQADESELESVKGVGSSTAPDLISNAQSVFQEMHGVDTETDSESDDDEDEVSIEDLEEINQEEPEGYNEPRDEEDVTAEDDTDEEEHDVTPDTFDVTIEIPDGNSFDYTVAALVNLRDQRISSNQKQARVADGLLDEFRGLGGAGEFTITVDSEELNTLHSAIKQTATNYQGRNVDAYNALMGVLEQVQDAREEYLF